MSKIEMNQKAGNTKWRWGIIFKRIMWIFFGQPLLFAPRPFHKLFPAIIEFFGAKITGHILIMPGVRILMPWNLTCHAGVVLGRSVQVYNYANISIGRSTVISQNTFLCTGTHDYNLITMPLVWKPIVIGDNCWIASHCFISPGVEIADGAIAAARSVITRNVAAWTIVGGNPAKIIREREMPTSLVAIQE